MNPHILESTTPRSQRFIALLTLLLVGAALVVLFGWSRGWLRHRADYRITLSENAGVSKSSLVVINGLPVGRVRETRLIERDGALRVEVLFWIDASQSPWLRRGSRILVRSDLVNAARLELQPALGATEILPAGSEFPAALAPDLFAQILELQPTIKNLLGEVSTLIAGLNERTARFDPILSKVETQLDAIGLHLTSVAGTVDEARGLLGQIKQDEATLVAGLDASLHTLNTELLPELTSAVRTNDADLGIALDSLNRTLGNFEKQLPALLSLSEQTLKNSSELTEAAANTWPLSRYTKKKKAESAKTTAASK